MKKAAVLVGLVVTALLLMFCNRSAKKESASTNPYQDSPYAALRDSVGYVGMQTCMGCHPNVHSTFQHTGMGESWDKATREKSSAVFDQHALVYDSTRNFYYRPHWVGDSLYITEFRLNGKDTTHKRTEKISYVVGSGHHTNSHIWRVNGFLYQAPITFYTQQGFWDLAPGFGDAGAARWDRIISQECMNCHNMYPEADFGAENRFVTVKQGIECERCHGPGEAHVLSKQRGERVDTSKEIDYTIVNPANLSRDKQVELCQRCHLQGITVLNEGKTYFDFIPGMDLKDVMNVFMPRYEGFPEGFIMASHADRMKQSPCFQKSATLSCQSCHNPHVSVRVTPAETFNASCTSCHVETKAKQAVLTSTNPKDVAHGCTETMHKRMAVNDNCYTCHMPVSETLDIPHVTIHDHKIQVPPQNKTHTPLRFTHLECLTDSSPSALVMAQGYLSAFEGYSAQAFLLDSAFKYLRASTESNQIQTVAWIRYYFLRNDYPNVLASTEAFSKTHKPDPWTNYRIGEAYYQTNDYANALERFNAALSVLPRQLDFLDKKGKTLVMLKRNDEAIELFHHILTLNPSYEKALSNLSFLQLQKGDLRYAETLVNKALSLNPDDEDALMNKAAVLVAGQKIPEAILVLARVLELNPKNEKARVAIGHIRNR